MKAIPTIQKYMTTSPHSVGRDQPLAVAHRLMHDNSIRHLPVLDGGHLVGVVTARDLALMESMAGVDAQTTAVEDVMSTTIYSVSPDSPLDEVCSEMAEHKYGSAIVMQNSKVVGIFTTVDVCRTLHELLHTRLKA